MTETTELPGEPGGTAHHGPSADSDVTATDRAERPTPMPKIGVWSWSFVGFVAAAIIIAFVLAAFLGGGLAVIVALGDGGLPDAAIMLLIVLASNLLLENFVEPKVMGHSLDMHPLIVLVVTAMGGLVGGIVGLILAVPAYVITRDAISRFRSRGIADMVAGRAQPAVDRLLK